MAKFNFLYGTSIYIPFTEIKMLYYSILNIIEKRGVNA